MKANHRRLRILAILLTILAFSIGSFAAEAAEPSPAWQAYLRGDSLQKVRTLFEEEWQTGTNRAEAALGLAHLLHATGNREQAFVTALVGLSEEPASPLAFLLEDMIREDLSFNAETLRLAKEMLPVLVEAEGMDPLVRFQLLWLSNNLAMSTAGPAEMEAAERACGFLPGAFFSEPISSFPRLEFSRLQVGERGPVDPEGWEYFPLTGPQVRMPSYRLDDDTENLSVAIFPFEVAESTDAWVYLNGFGSFEASMDGKPLAGRNYFVDQTVPTAMVGVHLDRGLHRLVLKFHMSWSQEGMNAALLGPGGKALEIRPLTGGEALSKRTSPSKVLGPFVSHFESAFDRSDPRAPALDALRQRWLGDVAGARLVLEEVAKEHPEAFPWNLWVARLYLMEAMDLPETIAQSRAERYLNAVLATAPDCPMALYYQAELLEARSDNGEELALLRNLSHSHTGDPRWALRLAGLLWSRGWGWQGRRILEEVTTYHPECPHVFMSWITYYKRIPDRKEQAEAIERLAEFSYSGYEWGEFYRSMRDWPKLKSTLLKMADRFGDYDLDWAMEIADIDYLSGDLEGAAASYEAILETAPNHDDAAMGLARTLFRKGDVDGGWRILDTLRERDPGTFQVDVAHWMFGEPLPFEEQYLDLETVLEEDTTEGPEEAPSSLILDQALTRVLEDGSSVERYHTIIRINDKNGVDREGEQAIPGQVLLAARTVKPDGTILEPEEMPEKRTLSMPGLEPGDLVELEYIAFQGENRIRNNSYITPIVFLFQDIDRPFHRTQWRIEYPESMDMQFYEQKLPHPGKRSRENGMAVVDWDFRSMPRIVPEPNTPYRHQYIPLAEAVGNLDWSDIGTYLRESMTGLFQNSPELRKVYAENIPGDGLPEEKLDAILEYLFRAIDGEEDAEWADPTQAILTRQGSRLPVAAVLLDMAEISWDVLLAEPVPNRIEKLNLPRLGQYAIPILEVRLSGEDPRYYQLTSPYRTLGVLPWYLQGARALRVTSDDPSAPVILPKDFKPWSDPRELETRSLQENGDLRANHSQEFDPDTSEAFRSAFHRIPRDQWNQAIQISLSREYGNLELEDLDMGSLDETDSPFNWRYEILLKGFAVPDGERWVISEPFPVLNLSQGLASLKDRLLPMAPDGPIFINQEFTLTLPDGLETEYSPPSLFVETPFGTYSLEGIREGKIFRFLRTLEIPYQIVEAEDYQAFAAFLREVDRVEAGQMILTGSE